MGYASGRGWGQLGRGLTDIGRTIGTLRREKTEDERRKTEDTRRHASEDLATELGFIDRGGGMGPAAPMQGTIGAPTSGGFEAPALLPEPTGVGMPSAGLLPTPDLGSKYAGGVTLEEPDPRFANVGPGHVMKPGVMEEQRRIEAEGRLSRSMAPFLGEGIDPTMAAEALTSGVPSGVVFPEPGGPLSREDRLRMSNIDPATGRPFPSTSTVERPPIGAPTYDQAMEVLREVYAEYGAPPYPGAERPWLGSYSVSPQTMHERAMAMARGGSLPSLPEPTADPPELRDPVLARTPGVRGWLERTLPWGAAGWQLEEPTVEPDTIPEPIARGIDPTAEQRRAWDSAAAVLRARNQEPDSVLGPRPPDAPITGSRGAGPSRPTTPAARRPITQDQAEYLRVVRGMAEGDIRRLYDVR